MRSLVNQNTELNSSALRSLAQRDKYGYQHENKRQLALECVA